MDGFKVITERPYTMSACFLRGSGPNNKSAPFSPALCRGVGIAADYVGHHRCINHRKSLEAHDTRLGSTTLPMLQVVG